MKKAIKYTNCCGGYIFEWYNAFKATTLLSFFVHDASLKQLNKPYLSEQDIKYKLLDLEENYDKIFELQIQDFKDKELRGVFEEH